MGSQIFFYKQQKENEPIIENWTIKSTIECPGFGFGFCKTEICDKHDKEKNRTSEFI
jgi:hypothetical protein